MKEDLLGSQIALSNRAVNYGDGCFTTIALLFGVVQQAERHITRLKNDCERLSIPFNRFQQLESELNQIASQNSTERYVVKVLISRGEGGRGYSPKGCSQPQFHITIHSFPSHYDTWQSQGITLGLSALRLGLQPMLAGIKHLNRLEQVLIKQELDDSGFDDMLVLDSNENVVECSASNVFWYSSQSGWHTPILEKSGVAGVMRETVLAYMQEKDETVQLGDYSLDSVLASEAVFICNSLMGIVPVKNILENEQKHQFDPRYVDQLITAFKLWTSH